MTSSCLAKFEGRWYTSLQQAAATTQLPNLNDTFAFETLSTTTNLYESITTTQVTTASSNQYLSQNRDEAKIMISMCLTFFTGIFHVCKY